MESLLLSHFFSEKKASEILKSADSGTAATIGLLLLLREKSSLRAISKRLDISSSGYLADVISTRRALSLKYVERLARILDFDKVEEMYLYKTLQNEKPRNFRLEALHCNNLYLNVAPPLQWRSSLN